MVVIRYCILALALVVGSVSVVAQDKKHFSGVYLGLESGALDLGDDNGIAFGGFLGYRYQTDGNMVFGAELDLIGQNGSRRAGDGDNDGTALVQLLGTVGFVAGRENRNLYTFGAGYVGEIDFGDFFDDEGSLPTDGFTILAGYERALGSGFSVRVRGQYVDAGRSKGYLATVGLLFSF
ncbi:MAG: outer membrane beta-barrel protein [Kordiimonadaceae bacterium]|nr:outer membrane beta-barrel protein [Kordiimonadaceae bacterium]